MNPKGNIYNYFTLAIIGLLFEILGAFLVSMESIGIEWFKKTYKVIYNYSTWSKKSLTRMILLIIPVFIPITFGIIFNSTPLLTIGIILILISGVFSLLVDHPDYYENIVIKRTNEHRIGPLGFIIMIIGFFLQLISVCWQMFVTIK
jgi:hypothetical protein